MAAPLLAVEGLVKSYKGRRVVDGVDLQVEEGTIVGLLGPNGAGKTTTFSMCMGMVKPEAGKVFMRGTDVTRFPIHKRARMGLGYLAQEPSVFRRLTVEENILAVLEIRGHGPEERKTRCGTLLEEFGLEALKESPGRVLSGGERRRLEIARALATDPSILLLDEPFSGIDPVAVEEIQETLVHLRKNGIAILLTDHNVRETLHITDRTWILADGKVLAHGTAQELADNETVRRVYLGKRFELA